MTTSASVEETVLETLSQVLDEPVEDLRAQPKLAAHDWDSLRSLDTLSQLENKLGLSFDLRAFNSANTIDDLIALAESSS